MEKMFALIIGILGTILGGVLLKDRGKSLLKKLLSHSKDEATSEKKIDKVMEELKKLENLPPPPETKDLTPDEVKKYWKDKLQ